MRGHLLRQSVTAALLVSLVSLSASSETLTDRINRAFVELTVGKLQGASSSDLQQQPFGLQNNPASRNVAGAMASLITTNASAFPLSSTSSGLTFDLSSGVPVATTTSTGPIFADRATTLGRGRRNFGFNFSQRNLSRVRGLATDKVAFRLTRFNIGAPGLGDQSSEWDTIDLYFDLKMDATILALYGTYGLTDRLDVGFAVPIINLTMTAEPTARINSVSGQASNFNNTQYWYGGTQSNPTLTTSGTPIDQSVLGFGDIALRTKYHLTKNRLGDLAALIEARLPTGNEDNFLGVGDASFRFMMLASQTGEKISPHVNVGFDWRLSDLDRNDFEVVIGYDQKLSDKFTMALDWQGQFEVGGKIAAISIPDPISIGRPGSNGMITTDQVLATNIPNYSKDNIVNTSFGVKYAPGPKWLFILNLMLPNNDGGIRSNTTWTFGMEAKL